MGRGFITVEAGFEKTDTEMKNLWIKIGVKGKTKVTMYFPEDEVHRTSIRKDGSSGGSGLSAYSLASILSGTGRPAVEQFFDAEEWNIREAVRRGYTRRARDAGGRFISGSLTKADMARQAGLAVKRLFLIFVLNGGVYPDNAPATREYFKDDEPPWVGWESEEELRLSIMDLERGGDGFIGGSLAGMVDVDVEIS